MRFPFPPMEAPIRPPESEMPIGGSPSRDSSSAIRSPEDAAEYILTSSPAPLAVAVEDTKTFPDNREGGIIPADAKPEAQPTHPPPPRSKRKVIAFPKPITPEPVYRLADPVVSEPPRILEVPEELEAFPATPLLDGLQFSAREQPSATVPADHIELPLQAVRISQRLFAGLIDCALVIAAAAVFGGTSFKLLPKLAFTKPVLLTGVVLLTLLWAVYQYLFIMYGGKTVGMKMVGIRLSSFKGGVPGWRQRRSRVLGLYFSAASIMMGLLWVLVDVDALCWHDRISQTYLTTAVGT